jgi:hypothetical protein
VATYLRQPELAKKNPKRIFLGAQDGGSFERVFGPELSAEKLVNAQRLAGVIDDFVKQFMTRKRRKERVGDWKADYKVFLGDRLVDLHSDVIDQVIPQSAVFLCAILFEEWVTLKKGAVEDFIKQLETGNQEVIKDTLELLITFAKSDPKLAKSWPTLLKSQSFFDNFASFLKGRLAP